ncbi:hypothetical protein NDU88_002035 [Pleurodeles waltl]|uniref:Secreted protein n=1 Tax=Pleurodeles waltl TaxID=8319 RepID=A0AAV7WNB4_PLEWA|nr:hypothetical protein NDU88_002035 [Pleurodeles waltl]
MVRGWTWPFTHLAVAMSGLFATLRRFQIRGRKAEGDRGCDPTPGVSSIWSRTGKWLAALWVVRRTRLFAGRDLPSPGALSGCCRHLEGARAAEESCRRPHQSNRTEGSAPVRQHHVGRVRLVTRTPPPPGSAPLGLCSPGRGTQHRSLRSRSPTQVYKEGKRP